METILTIKDRKVVIGPEQPFVIIGERINPTRRKKLAESMAQGDFSVAQEDARKQVAAGAQVLDVNAGIPGADEPVLLRSLTLAVLEEVEAPLCLDTANPDALAAALEVYPGKALINSTTAEAAMMARVFPLAKRYGAAVIGVITDENGIPATPEERLRVARKLVNTAGDYGIPPEDILIDCLALTVGADSKAGKVTLDFDGAGARYVGRQPQPGRQQRFLWPARPQDYQCGLPGAGQCARPDRRHHRPDCARNPDYPAGL